MRGGIDGEADAEQEQREGARPHDQREPAPGGCRGGAVVPRQQAEDADHDQGRDHVVEHVERGRDARLVRDQDRVSRTAVALGLALQEQGREVRHRRNQNERDQHQALPGGRGGTRSGTGRAADARVGAGHRFVFPGSVARIMYCHRRASTTVHHNPHGGTSCRLDEI